MAKRWYIVHAYSNFENKVAESIREQAKQRGLEELFEHIMVPKEKVTEVRRGRVAIGTRHRLRPGNGLPRRTYPQNRIAGRSHPYRLGGSSLFEIDP